MAYDYYCMECGRNLNQETVLFDMQYLLTRDKEKQFQILKFRMDLTELKNLISKGTLEESGYHGCELTLAEVAHFISNGNNLKKEEIAELTMEDIRAYIEDANTLFDTQYEKKKSTFDNVFAEDEDEEIAVQERPAYVRPAAILAMEATDQANTDKAFTQNALRADLEILQSVFLSGNVMTFRIKEEFDTDNEGDKVLVGYNVQFLTGNIYLTVESRVCSGCGAAVFPHAGTAKHQSIAFIGYQSAGKTSTILALTHYAQNHMMIDLSDFGDDGAAIWHGTDTIPNVATVELLEKNRHLQEDLRNYSKGLAPNKTAASKRTDAYCATFRIKNKAQNKYYLLTLTDLPGELCEEDGTVQADVVEKNFSVALNCDAYIACFDTSAIDPTGGGIASWVMNVCNWTDEFQKLRASYNQVDTYVPTMLLFTKCEDLEQPNAAGHRSKGLLPIEQTYSLKNERMHISDNKLYKFVRDQFNEFGQLSKAYHAMMRCSPYGYAAPSQQDLDKNPNRETKRPEPKNVDILMRWLLSVSGCIPTEGEYRRNPMSPSTFRLNNFCISRPQLRTQNPMKEQDLDESLARCTLFENPGYYDEKLLVKYDTPWQLLVIRFEAKMRPDSNAR